jgi:hypothetical protein
MENYWRFIQKEVLYILVIIYFHSRSSNLFWKRKHICWKAIILYILLMLVLLKRHVHETTNIYIHQDFQHEIFISIWNINDQLNCSSTSKMYVSKTWTIAFLIILKIFVTTNWMRVVLYCHLWQWCLLTTSHL